jgi:hypothetical protein
VVVGQVRAFFQNPSEASHGPGYPEQIRVDMHAGLQPRHRRGVPQRVDIDTLDAGTAWRGSVSAFSCQ